MSIGILTLEDGTDWNYHLPTLLYFCIQFLRLALHMYQNWCTVECLLQY